MTLPFPEPTDPLSSRAEVFLGYLDYFRSVAISKLQGLTDQELRSTRLPSGWVPLALLRHLAYVEYRWLVWGFEGRQVTDPWGDLHDGRLDLADDDRSEERRVGKAGEELRGTAEERTSS